MGPGKTWNRDDMYEIADKDERTRIEVGFNLNVLTSVNNQNVDLEYQKSNPET